MGSGFSSDCPLVFALAEQELRRAQDGSDLSPGKESVAEVSRLRHVLNNAMNIASPVVSTKYRKTVALLHVDVPGKGGNSYLSTAGKKKMNDEPSSPQAPSSPIPILILNQKREASESFSSTKSSARTKGSTTSSSSSTPRTPLLGLTDNWAAASNRKAKAAIIAAFANGGASNRKKARCHLPIPVQRWQAACHQVVIQNEVEKARLRWTKYQKCQALKQRRASVSWRERFNC
jgi:hypothetical protein